MLSSSEGNILEDASAIQILSEAKIISNEIQDKEVIAERTQSEIDAARTGYKPGGAYNAILAPNTLTTYGPAIAEPVGRIHWAGTEASLSKWTGYFEGAVQAGNAAAQAVLKRL